MPTLLGLCVLPLALLWAGRPERLLQLILVAAVFEGAAALVLGGFGVQPAIIPVLIFIGYVGIQYLLGMRYPAEGEVLRLLLPLLLLLAYAAGAAMLLPGIFAGRIIVLPQKLLDPGLVDPVPLVPNSGNVTQTLYLAVNVALSVAAALFLTRGRIAWRGILSAYLAGGYLVGAISLWQFASRVAGVPYPSGLLYSNPGWAIVEQSIGPVPRIQGPFSEPAALAFYMSGVTFCALWLCIRGHDIMRPNWLLGLAALTTCLSTSTTGIATLVVGLPATLLYATLTGNAPGLRRATTTLLALLGAGAVLLGPIFILRPELIDVVELVVDITLDKGESDSFLERQMMDNLAWDAVSASGGLGIGWGSTRASSLLPGLMAGGGVFAVLMAVWLAWGLARAVGRASASAPAAHPARAAVDGFAAAACGQLVAALLSAPTIVTVIFFLQLGAVAAGAARMRYDADHMRRAPAPRGRDTERAAICGGVVP